MMKRAVVVAALVAGAESTSATVSSTTARAHANPIRKVVTMLQMIVKKIEKEGKESENLQEAFMCECSKNQAGLQKQIESGEAGGADQAAALEAGNEQQKQLTQSISDAKKGRASAKETIATSTEIREKEAAAFAASKAESETNIDSMAKAIGALRQGMGGAFIQTDAAKVLRDLVQTRSNLLGAEDLSAFLQSGQTTEGTGEIVGMLEQLKEEMSGDLASAEAAEKDAIATYNDLVKAKTKEFETLQASIEEKMARLGEMGVANAELSNAGGDTAGQLEADKKALADLVKECAQREKDYKVEEKSRGEELLALADTIKMLNDDDALDLFKKALPGAASSFMQVTSTAAAQRSRALDVVHAAQQKHKGSTKLDFLALALHGKKAGFANVIALIDKMAANLKGEQKTDDEKKAYCLKEFDTADDQKKVLERKVADAQTAIEDAKESLATLVEEIKTLTATIKESDANVAEATAQRQKENANYKSTMAQNVAAKDLIGMAKNRMNKFYNPSQYNAPPKRELSEEDRIAVNMGGTAPPTPAPGGIAGTGISAFVQVSMHESTKKSSQEGAGVIAMMDLLSKDLENQITVGETEEKNAQEDYETAMADAKEQRIADSKSLGDKMTAKAETDDALDTHEGEKVSSTEELQGNTAYIASLHADCDWLLQNFDQRAEARTGEIDAMMKAKDVLKGADYSLLQVTHAHLRGVRQ